MCVMGEKKMKNNGKVVFLIELNYKKYYNDNREQSHQYISPKYKRESFKRVYVNAYIRLLSNKINKFKN